MDRLPEIIERRRLAMAGYDGFQGGFSSLDTPPGYSHSFESVGENDMIVLLWASEIYNPEKADTFFELVKG